MEYYKNLYPQPEKKKFQLILGIIFIILSIFWILNKMGDKILAFDWIYSSIFMLNGVSVIMQYFGYNIDELFGKRFIKITPEEISYKPKTLKPETKILWKNITSILLKVNHINIKYNNGEIINIHYNSLDYSSVQELKDTITEFARNNNFNLNS